jgi:two-component system phosphate regulon sensor histidine kinase PhoR
VTARIFLKVIAAVLLVMIVALTAIDFLGSRLAENAYISGLTLELEDKVKMLTSLNRLELHKLGQENIQQMAKAASGRVTVVAPDGRVLLDSEADPAKMDNHANRPEIRSALHGACGNSVRMSPTVGVMFLYVACPAPEGVIRIAVPLREIRTQVAKIRWNLLLYAALAFLPAILLAALFARQVSRRLGSIINYASSLSTGRFDVHLAKGGNDELGILAKQLEETGEKLQRMFAELQAEHAELEKLETIRKDFVINVSHELRTPLASIQGYTETLLDGAIDDKENNIRFLNIIRQNAERLGRLTADLLTLSRLELKSERLRPEHYYLNALLRECIDTLRPVAEKKKIQFIFEAANDADEVYCDSEAFHQIMANLLDNAIKYTPESGSITVSARLLPLSHSGSRLMWEIRVGDTGSGIPEEDLPRLFERFYRVDKARSRELGGTGLGLAIVKHLARAQGGDVYVESKIGEGSVFSFTLPASEPKPEDSRGVQGQLTTP